MSYQMQQSQNRPMPHGSYQVHNELPMGGSMKDHQTVYWLQNSYLADSGINSGATTQAPSLCGKEDAMDGDQLMFDLDQGFTQDQVNVPHGNYGGRNLPMGGSVKDQTLLWQQNSYLVDSAVHSSATTQAPSLSGKEEEMDGDLLMFDLDQGFPQGFTPEQGNSHFVAERNQQLTQQNRSQRGQAAMFPETLEEGIEIPSMQFDQQRAPPIQPLAEPSQMPPKHDVNHINYQDDADLATHVIPGLLKLLNDEDQVLISAAVTMVFKMSKKETDCHAIMKNPEMVAALIRAILNSNDLETTKGAIGTLCNLSEHKQGLYHIFNSGGIPALVKLLSSPVEAVLFRVIITLHNLLLHQEGSKMAVREAGGLQKMVTLLQRNNAKFLAIVTDCLQILALENKDSKLIILSSQGHVELLRIMRNCDNEKLLWTTARLLKVLSACSINKPAIVNAGGMQALSMHLGSPSQRLVTSCLLALRNLSDAGTNLGGMEGLLQSLVQLLGSPDETVAVCAVGILANLTCNNPKNKVTVCHVGGVDALVKTILSAGNREEITERAVCALRHLTSRHQECELAKNTIRQNYGLEFIVKLLQPPSSWLLIKAVLGLITNLALSQGNYSPLWDHDVIHHLVRLLMQAFQDMQNRMAVGNGGVQSAGMYADDVRIEDIIELTVGALHILAKESHIRPIIRNQVVITIFVQLLFSKIENIQRVAAGVLCELALDQEGSELIEQEGAIQPLTQLIISRNKGVATNASTALNRMAKGNNTNDYKKPVSMELSNSPYRGDQNLWNQELALSPDLQDMLSDQIYDKMHVSSGPASVHVANRGRSYQQGYDQIPIDSMQALDLGSQHDSNYGPMDVGPGDLDFDALDDLPQPPQDNNQAWYDTDL